MERWAPRYHRAGWLRSAEWDQTGPGRTAEANFGIFGGHRSANSATLSGDDARCVETETPRPWSHVPHRCRWQQWITGKFRHLVLVLLLIHLIFFLFFNFFFFCSFPVSDNYSRKWLRMQRKILNNSQAINREKKINWNQMPIFHLERERGRGEGEMSVQRLNHYIWRLMKLLYKLNEFYFQSIVKQ